jgi:hypothetical protein
MNREDNLKQIESLRRLKPYQRIKTAFELYDFARSRIAAQIKRNNPGITKKQLLNKLNERFTPID